MKELYVRATPFGSL
uniref:Uncharacterized protein n=1 Tax=Rhizophora mucronata TaxID=61149 RepID=A0A2P2P8Q7_RHIMU